MDNREDVEIKKMNELHKRRVSPLVKIDTELYYQKQLISWKKSINWIRISPIIMMILMAILFISFIINNDLIYDDLKMIYLSGFVIIVTLMTSVIQYIITEKNDKKLDSIEHHLLLQNHLLILQSNLTLQEKNDAVKVLDKIGRLESVKNDEFITIDIDKQIQELQEELKKSK